VLCAAHRQQKRSTQASAAAAAIATATIAPASTSLIPSCSHRCCLSQLGLPVMEIVLARSLVLLALSTGMLMRQGRAAEWPWRSKRYAVSRRGWARPGGMGLRVYKSWPAGLRK